MSHVGQSIRSQDLSFWQAIARLPLCILTTNAGSGLRSRPMAPRVDSQAGQIRFLTRFCSHKVEEISKDAHVALTFLSARGNAFITIAGTAELSRARGLIDALWDDEAEVWFPDGRDGPDVAVICVTPQTAERWDRDPRHNVYSWISFEPV